MDGPVMDGLEIAYRRLHQQHLAGEPLADPVAVVRHLGAMQAQEYAVAKWSIGQRTRGFDNTAIQRLIDDGVILRTHLLRPTWHFVAAADIGWMQALTGPRVRAFNGYYNRQHGLDDELAARADKAITAALKGGNYLTRDELGRALAKAGLEATGNRLAYVVMRAELDGLVANGPMRGRQHTYALISERVTRPYLIEGDAALVELTRRFFTGHGPATVKDFAWWSSLTVTQIRRGLALLKGELVAEVVDGHTFWFAPGEAPGREPSPSVHVLQGFDEYSVAYTEGRYVTNLAERTLTPPNQNTVIHPLVLDSQMVGYWRRRPVRQTLVAEPVLAVRLTAAQRRAVEAAFARYAEFAEVPVTVSWPG